jgi:crossover junction endodeoxyribonuclease RuvC
MRIAVDVGLTGAFALLTEKLRAVEVVDMPTMPYVGSRYQVNPVAVGNIIRKWVNKYGVNNLTAYVEYEHAVPHRDPKTGKVTQEGAASMFGFGTSYGIVQGVLGAFQVKTVFVKPSQWKARAGLTGSEKDKARTLAQQLFPSVDLSLKKSIGKADALCIGYFADA